MMMVSGIGRAMTAAMLALGVASCSAGGNGNAHSNGAASSDAATALPVTVASAQGRHVFTVEIAKTAAQQEKGLMYRTGMKSDAGMLFWPYPPAGGAPQAANFWMKNTPTPLDIVFIRADGTIARIAENTVPFSETPIPSGEPVSAVLEIIGGRSADLGIATGDKVSWPGQR